MKKVNGLADFLRLKPYSVADNKHLSDVARVSEWLIFITIWLCISLVYADTWVSESRSKTAKPEKSKAAEETVSFNEYRGGLRNLCLAVGQDGRQELLYNILKPHEGKDPTCASCRPFFSMFATVCKPAKKPTEKKKPKPKKGEDVDPAAETPVPTPTITPIYLQREPNIRAIEFATQVFSAMSQREEGQEATIKVVRRLLSYLKEVDGRTAAEKDYLWTLASYIESPFREIFNSKSGEGHGVERRSLTAGEE